MSHLYLVTGGAGFIGSHIARRLVADGERVRVVDNLCTGDRERLNDIASAVEFIEGDLADPVVSDRAVDGADYVIHQAAIPSVQRSIRDPLASNRANITATLNLLESSRTRGVRKFVYAGSSSAYGDTAVLPKREDMVANPLSPYALQKLVGERYCKLYHELFRLETVSLRYFNIFGPGQDPHSEYSAVIPKFITKLLVGERLTVYGDGEQSRDFTYVDNVVEANLLALSAKDGVGKVFNIGCGARVSLNDLIRKLETFLGVRAEVDYQQARPGDVRDSLAAIDLARQHLGYSPQVSIDEGLKRTVEAFKLATKAQRAKGREHGAEKVGR
jgi:nucleoside-diphosphate-sugar epimerase